MSILLFSFSKKEGDLADTAGSPSPYPLTIK